MPVSESALAQAAQRLREGGLVAFPTETVYGLGAHALDPEAVARIYAAKGRPAWNPVIVHVPDLAHARPLSRAWPATAEALAGAFWPGPLTLVVPKAPMIPDVTTAGRDAVGIRVPAHPVALALLREAAIPVAAPSANRFTQVSPTTADDVARSLGDRVDCLLDGGPCEVGIESTVVDCTGPDVVLLRPGMISAAEIAQVVSPLGVTVRTAAPVSLPHDAGAPVEAPRGPGMVDRHYAPTAEVWLVAPPPSHDVQEALEAAFAAGVDRGPVRALWRTLDCSRPGLDVQRMPTDPAPYARALYRALHDADAAGVTLLLIELPPTDDSAWDGVRDRLTRASR
ncbi:MAG: hypothetical protein RLZZ621_1291 [Gemmatimonadota bacterium]